MKPLAIGLSAAAIIIIVILLKTCKDNAELEQENRDLNTIITEKNDTTRYFQNKYNQEVAVRKSAEGKLSTLQSAYGNIDSIATMFDIKAKNLRSYISYITEGKSDLKPVNKPEIVYRDTGRVVRVGDTCPPEVKYMQQTFTNPYYTAFVRIGDSSFHHLTSRDTAYVSFSWGVKKKGFLNLGMEYFPQVGVIHADTSKRTTIVQSFTVRESLRNPYKWSVSAFAGWTYPLTSDFLKQPGNTFKTAGQFRIGLGLSRNIINLR